jgi:hypothetical protein
VVVLCFVFMINKTHIVIVVALRFVSMMNVNHKVKNIVVVSTTRADSGVGPTTVSTELPTLLDFKLKNALSRWKSRVKMPRI